MITTAPANLNMITTPLLDAVENRLM